MQGNKHQQHPLMQDLYHLQGTAMAFLLWVVMPATQHVRIVFVDHALLLCHQTFYVAHQLQWSETVNSGTSCIESSGGHWGSLACGSTLPT